MVKSEKVIIDGIDVSECNFRLEREGKQKCECTHATGFGVICDCENWHNCYFKQLKRLEKEVKHWQTEHREAKAKGEWTYDLVRKKVDRLKQENKQIKSALKEIREDMEKDTTCESRECGCDDYGECLKCVKETILDKINEVLNDRN